MKTKKCRNAQCRYNATRVPVLERWCADYKNQIEALETKLKEKQVDQNDQNQFNWMRAKQQLVQSMAIALESCAHAIADPRRY